MLLRDQYVQKIVLWLVIEKYIKNRVWKKKKNNSSDELDLTWVVMQESGFLKMTQNMHLTSDNPSPLSASAKCSLNMLMAVYYEEN